MTEAEPPPPVACPLCGRLVTILTTATGQAVSLALTEPCLCAFGDRTRIGRGKDDATAEEEAIRAVSRKTAARHRTALNRRRPRK